MAQTTILKGDRRGSECDKYLVAFPLPVPVKATTDKLSAMSCYCPAILAGKYSSESLTDTLKIIKYDLKSHLKKSTIIVSSVHGGKQGHPELGHAKITFVDLCRQQSLLKAAL